MKYGGYPFMHFWSIIWACHTCDRFEDAFSVSLSWLSSLHDSSQFTYSGFSGWSSTVSLSVGLLGSPRPAAFTPLTLNWHICPSSRGLIVADVALWVDKSHYIMNTIWCGNNQQILEIKSSVISIFAMVNWIANNHSPVSAMNSEGRDTKLFISTYFAGTSATCSQSPLGPFFSTT